MSVIIKIEKKNEPRKKIKIRKYCRFHQTCEHFYPASFTCTHRGGEYCGMFRKLASNRLTNKNKKREEKWLIQ